MMAPIPISGMCRVRVCIVGVCTVGVCRVRVCIVGVCTVGVCIVGVCIVGVCTVGVCIVGVCIVGVCTVGVCIVGVCRVGVSGMCRVRHRGSSCRQAHTVTALVFIMCGLIYVTFFEETSHETGYNMGRWASLSQPLRPSL